MNTPLIRTSLGAGTLTLAFAFALAGFAGAQSGRMTGQAQTVAQPPQVQSGQSQAQTPPTQQTEADKQKAQAQVAANKAQSEKTHMINGNNAMHDAQAIRQQLLGAPASERSALLAKMHADYLTAVDEYKQALNNTMAVDADSIQTFGLIRLLRNGLITHEKAVEMVTQDKNVPTILSNLGMAYSGAGDFEDGMLVLEEASVSKQDPATYMQLGTDYAELGKVPEALETCDKAAVANPAATNVQASCYKNVGIVLTNRGKLADAASPLQKATQLNPNDALAWKLLGDSLSNGISTRQESGKMVYVIPPGTIEAYQKYLQLDPNGPLAGQVKAVLDGFAQLPKASSSSGTSN